MDNKILDKLGKIKAHMESAKEIGNEAEAQAFAAMLQNLLAKHKLEMTDLQYSSHLQDEPVEEFAVGGASVYKDGKRVMERYPDIEFTSKRSAWAETLAAIITRAHSCQIIVSIGSSRLWMVGRKSDAMVAEYLFVTLFRAAERLSHKEYKRFRAQCRARDNGGGRYLHETHNFKASWLSGFINRLHERFEEEKYSGTALVRINKEALAVKQYMEQKKGKKANHIQGNNARNAEGYNRGRKAADGLNISNNAVAGGNQARNAQLN